MGNSLLGSGWERRYGGNNSQGNISLIVRIETVSINKQVSRKNHRTKVVYKMVLRCLMYKAFSLAAHSLAESH